MVNEKNNKKKAINEEEEDDDLNNSSTDGQELSINKSDCDGEQEEQLNNFEDEDLDFCNHLNNDSKKVISKEKNPKRNSVFRESILSDGMGNEIYFYDGEEDESGYSVLRGRRRTVTSAMNDQREINLRRKSRTTESCYSGISHSYNENESSGDSIVEDGVDNNTQARRIRVGITHGNGGNFEVEVQQENYDIQNHELFSGFFYLTQEQLDSLNL